MNASATQSKSLCPLCGCKEISLSKIPLRSASYFVPCCYSCYRTHFDYDNSSVLKQVIFNHHLINNLGGFNV